MSSLPFNMEGSTASAQSAQRQVRLQLTTRDADFALPENTGPILVPTGNYDQSMYNSLIRY